MIYRSGDPLISGLEHVLMCFVKHGDLKSIYEFQEKEKVGEDYINWCLYLAYKTTFDFLYENISYAVNIRDIKYAKEKFQELKNKLTEFSVFLERTDEIINCDDDFSKLDKIYLENEHKELQARFKDYEKNFLIPASKNCGNDEEKVLNLLLQRRLLPQNN